MDNGRGQGGDGHPGDYQRQHFDHNHHHLTPPSTALSYNAAAHGGPDTLPPRVDPVELSPNTHGTHQLQHHAQLPRTDRPQFSWPQVKQEADSFPDASTVPLNHDERVHPATTFAPLTSPFYQRSPQHPLHGRRHLPWASDPQHVVHVRRAPATVPPSARRPGPNFHISMTPKHTELAVLNAQQYDTGLADPRSAGMPVNRPLTRTSKVPRLRDKRPLQVDDADEDAQEVEDRRKRSRGRPRLDTTDETAADRRRTQIRLAQRAYRHRKDTAITTLEEKVKGLQKVNSDMSKELNGFLELAVAQGMLNGAPHLADHFRSMSEKLSSLAQKASTYDDDDLAGSRSEGDGSRSDDTTRVKTDQGAGSSRRDSGDPDSHARSASIANLGDANIPSSLTSDTPGPMPPPVTLPYEVIAQPTMDNASFPIQIPMESQLFENYFNPAPEPSPWGGLPAPQSFAYQEPTFGKRLQRTASEAGLRLVSMSSPPPSRYAAVFGFCLLFESRDDIFHRLSTGLKRSREESLSIWTVPFTNLGGSGLFFQDHGSDGRSMDRGLPAGNEGMREVQKPQEVTGFSMGPFSARVESARDMVDGRLRMKYGGFEGDFYDSEETELYLRKRGIVIPPQADFVDVELDINNLGQINECGLTRETPSSEDLYGGPGTDVVEFSFPGMMRQNAGSSGNVWPANTRTGASSGYGAPLPMFSTPESAIPQLESGLVQYMCPSIPQRSAEPFAPSSKIKTTLNVQTLIFELLGKSVCVGRTSAVRPKDIDRAIRIASGLDLAPLHNPV